MSYGLTAKDEQAPTETKTEIKIVTATSHAGTQTVAEIEVRPREQPYMSLGSFTDENPPKGYVIEINPEPDLPESIVTKVMHIGSHKKYELILHIANYSSQTINAEVRQL